MDRLTVCTALLAAVLSLPVAAVAAETGMPDDAVQAPPTKDECLLYLAHCDTSVQSLQDKVDRLTEEIAKGTRVYSVEELRILEGRLKEVNRILDMLMDYRDWQ